VIDGSEGLRSDVWFGVSMVERPPKRVADLVRIMRSSHVHACFPYVMVL